MAIVNMKKLTMIGLEGDRQKLLTRLADLGIVHIEFIEKDKAKYKTTALQQAANYRDQIEKYRSNQTLLEELITYSSDLRHLKKPMFTVRRIVEADALNQAGRDEEAIMADASRLEYLQIHEGRVREQKLCIEKRRDALTEWHDLILPECDDHCSKRLAMRFGTLPDAETLEVAKQALTEGLESYAIQIVKRGETSIAVAVLFLKEEENKGERILLQNHFANFPDTGDPKLRGDLALAYEKSTTELKRIDAELEAIREESLALAVRMEDFECLYDFYQQKTAELVSASKLFELRHIFVLEGYVPAKNAEAMVNLLFSEFSLAIDLEDPGEDDDIPVLLQNNALVEPYEAIVETFSLPKPNVDPDPTFVMSIFYALSFGLMLGDVGYGLLLSIICGILVWKVKVEGNMLKMCKLFFQTGIVSMFFGLLFGGFFGNAITEISGGAVNFPTLWFNPMDDPIKMMIWSIVFGVLHIFGGMGLDIYKKFKNGEAYDAIFSVAPWFLIIIGLGLMLLGISWAQWLALIGAALILFFSKREKNPIKRIFGGLGGLYGVTGYFSDLLSYTRILALALCTSVIAMVVNMMAMLPGVKGIGFIFFLIIMLIGHALNLALSALSAYVHTTRLQYVEFFGKFYEGGGRQFDPLRINSKYTKTVAKATE